MFCNYWSVFESLWFTLSVYLRLLSVWTYFVLFLFILSLFWFIYLSVCAWTGPIHTDFRSKWNLKLVESRVIKLLQKFNALVLLCFFQMLMSVWIRMVGVVTTAATQLAPTAVPVCLDTHSTPLITRVKVSKIVFWIVHWVIFFSGKL